VNASASVDYHVLSAQRTAYGVEYYGRYIWGYVSRRRATQSQGSSLLRSQPIVGLPDGTAAFFLT
jgi:hypothetical protein